MTTPRKRAAASVAVIAAGALALSACAQGGGGGPAPSAAAGRSQDVQALTRISVGTAEDSRGPAAPEPGAVKGGTVNMIDRDDFSHLDPARIYLNYNATASKLFTRQLTEYKIGDDGSIKLVGDLAVDPGTTEDGGKTWRFTLKDGLKWQDGSPITTADVKHTFERIFAPFTPEGPPYAEQWLLPEGKEYTGPYDGEHLDTIKAVDEKTIEFTLNAPHPDFNFTVAMTGYGIVPEKHDTKEKYDRQPFSSGPYKIVSHVTDKSMDLERNEHWDPATDPIRNAYPDKWHMEFGVQALQSTDRFIADNGDDKNAMTFHNPVATERLQQVTGDPELMRRTVSGLTPYTTFYNINTSRIKDVRVRQAIIKAFPMQQVRQLQGGELGAGKYASTVMSPTVLGYESFDLYGQQTRPQGDPEAAKKLLAEAGQPNPTLVYAYNQTPTQEKTAVAIKTGLEKAGFKVVTKPLNPTTFYDAVGMVNNPYDVYWGGWAADWPTGFTSLSLTYDGRQIADQAPNYSHLNDPKVNAAIDEAAKITDPAEAGKAWARVDRMIMELAPIVPEFYQTYFGLYGSGLGGVEFDPITGEQSPTDVYVKQ
ncbi:peptide/nickel transport system substrate-binding protein [Thermocatellispora tengchongensis]|uniref:Peptide/nickel transport system substrate-binding protein n=1 Tax=Thermocatellispora tengchongensis TaxID=1073253 RepID=A0A840NVX8_9ACTN|nr:ABC transporter substrate-binding protein [Thermocatellispora tengchongensis]MBB5131678.1 peptide/nickel transport system substrate-binding protein [Thermocatellispora tengchongensis]